MSEVNFPSSATWNSKLKFSIVFPSEFELGSSVSEIPDIVLAVVDEVSVSGVGYTHEDILGLTKWGLGKRTRPSPNKTGRIIVSELDWASKFIRWLAKSDAYFDIKVIELDSLENPSRGQWVPGQEMYVGCKIDAYDKTYSVGEEPKAVVPFSWTLVKYQEGTGQAYIGSGLFSDARMPTIPSS